MAGPAQETVVALAIEPIIGFPAVAQAGKTYLLTVDVRPLDWGEHWPYQQREECVIYCLLDSMPLFRNEPLGEPAIVLHRFGGTYGPAKFLIHASEQPQEGSIQVTLVNGWGIPLTTLQVPNIKIQQARVELPRNVIRVSQTVSPPEPERETPFSRKRILWVDDFPSNIETERSELELEGALVTLALSTEEALRHLNAASFDAIISDLGRREDEFAGFGFLDQVVQLPEPPPVAIYAGSRALSYEHEALVRGALICTNSFNEVRKSLLEAFAEIDAGATKYLTLAQARRFTRAVQKLGLEQAIAQTLLSDPYSSTWEEVWRVAEQRATTALPEFLIRLIDQVFATDYNQFWSFEQGRLLLVSQVIGHDKATYEEASLSGVIGRAANTKRTVYVPNVRDDPRYIPAEPTTQAELAIPILKPGSESVVSVINIESPNHDAFTPRQVEWLEAMCYSFASTTRSTYFEKLSDDWRQRVKVARKERHPGDILALAGDMPTRLHRKQLLWQCARALVELHRFEQARGVLEELLEMDRDNFDAQSFLALVDNRLGRSANAEESLDALVNVRPGDGEAQGMLGRVYKDLWRVAWKDQPTLEERQSVAMENAVIAAKAIASYERALRQNLSNYYNGINVVTLQSLLDFLAEKTGALPTETGVDDLAELVSVVSVATRQALKNPKEAAWAAPTLGELELIRGNAPEALQQYRDAANAPGVPYFEIDSMLGQLRLFDGLGFRSEAVAPVIKLLEKKLAQLGSPLPTFGKVVICSGHMIDKAGRVEARFPASKEVVVREKIASLLAAWDVGKGDLAICGGACGSDILFAEECQRRGAFVRLMLALSRQDFLSKSVAFAGNEWVRRFQQLANTCEVADQISRLGKPPADLDVFSRCNLWMLNTARVEVGPADHLLSILVWDEKPTGDGPGGTSDFAARVRDLGSVVEIINPTKLG